MVAEELKVVVRAEVDKAVSDMKKFQQSTGQASGETQNLSKSIGASIKQYAGLAIGIGAAVKGFQMLVKFAKESVEAFRVQELQEAKLEAVLKATGGAAGLTANELKKMAAEFQKTTRFGDEAVISAQAVLLTFKSIGRDEFPRTMQAAMDLSEAFGQDLKSSVMQVGKALEDPITGMGALRRVGVSFSESQQQVIKSLVATNKTAEAQAMILDVLEGQVGGVAKAMADTSQGAADQLKNAIGDLKETFGGFIDLGLRPAQKAMKEYVETLNDYLSIGNKANEMTKTMKSLMAGEFLSADQIKNNLEGVNNAIEEMEKRLEGFGGKAIGALGGEKALAAYKEQKRILEGMLEIRQKDLEISATLTDEWGRKRTDSLRAQAEEAKKIADEAERELAAKKEVESIYKTGYRQILDILEAEKYKGDEFQKQIDQLERLKWSAGEYETNRLAALEILRTKQAEAAEEQRLALLQVAMAYGEIVHIAGDALIPMTEEMTQYYMDLGQKYVPTVVDEIQEATKSQAELNNEMRNSVQILGGVSSMYGALSSLISASYDAQIEGIDKKNMTELQYEEKRKQLLKDQAIAQKAFALFQATLNVPSAILTALAQGGPALAAIAGITAVLQLAAIASAPIPKFARGGSFETDGPQYIQVGDNASGRERVTVEPAEDGYSNMMHVTVYLGPHLLYDAITEASKNGKILIDQRNVIKR
jgi:hypothetical protein